MQSPSVLSCGTMHKAQGILLLPADHAARWNLIPRLGDNFSQQKALILSWKSCQSQIEIPTYVIEKVPTMDSPDVSLMD